MSVEVRRAGERYRSVRPGVESRHSFSFGPHYDPANVGFGPLTAHNEERVGPGAGFPDHRHADVEIVTWVLAGALVHTDSLGHASVLRPGDLQVQSAGAGIVHAETGHPDESETRFVQAWLRPDEPGGEPTVAVASVDLTVGRGGELVPLVSGSFPALLGVGTSGATLWGGRLAAGEVVVLVEDPRQHLFVASGQLALVDADVTAGVGDAVRIAAEPGLGLVASALTDVLVWGFTG